jgi:hypothetical protein
MLSRVQVALIEPANGGQSWPSGLWGRDEVISVANQRQDQFLKDTLLLGGIATIAAIGIGTTRVTLPADWLRTLSVVWRGDDGTVRELMRSDSFEADHTIDDWETTDGTPLVYSEYETPNLQMLIMPGPAVDGDLELLYVPIGTELNGNGELLIVPDELEHAVRYGMLADLLSKDGRGKDPARAAYCEQRFQLGIDLTRIVIEGWA